MNPFSEKYDPQKDLALVTEAKNGSKEALEKLVRKHQRFIYNVALKLVKDPVEAADLSQEAFIKMLVKLDQFQGNSSFRSWAYRIVFNHFLEAEKKRSRQEVFSFQSYGDFLDRKYVDEEMTELEHQNHNQAIIDTRNKCLSSMLLCLSREQRIVFILGSIFNLKSTVAADVLAMTPENFRKQLSRARSDLFRFMDNKCGLINPSNPCSCSKKTKGFLKEGKLDSATKTFKQTYINEVTEMAQSKNDRLDKLINDKYNALFQAGPYHKRNISRELIDSILIDKDVLKLFRLN